MIMSEPLTQLSSLPPCHLASQLLFPGVPGSMLVRPRDVCLLCLAPSQRPSTGQAPVPVSCPQEGAGLPSTVLQFRMREEVCVSRTLLSDIGGACIFQPVLKNLTLRPLSMYFWTGGRILTFNLCVLLPVQILGPLHREDSLKVCTTEHKAGPSFRGLPTHWK